MSKRLVMKNFSVFEKSNILITGHTGFKGSWLTSLLLELGANITGVSIDVPTDPSNFVVMGLQKKINHINLDVTNTPKLKKIIENSQPDYIFHLAAQPLVRKSIKKPLETWNSNTLGTISVLESIKNLKRNCIVVFITSDKVYKNQEWAWGYRETDKLGGFDPYSASKASAELAINSYVKTYFNNSNIRIGVGRAGNVIGGGDWGEDRIIPDCVKSWSQNKHVNIRSPLSTRPWQHVLEPIFGYLTLALKLTADNTLHGEAFNFGPSERNNHSVSDLVNEMSKYWKKVLWNDVSFTENVINESNLLKLNCDKAKMYLDWEAIWDFETTVKHTSNWYKSFYENNKFQDLLIDQIHIYIEQLKSINK